MATSGGQCAEAAAATAAHRDGDYCGNYGSDDGDYVGEYDDDEEVEIEEVADDLPMQVAPRLFLGSIDAARNERALHKAGIAFTLALLSASDHANGDGIAATPTGNHAPASSTDSERIVRVEIALEDALDEPLLCKLPSILAKLNRILNDAERLDKNVLVHCVAGRSRSAAVVAAWLIAQRPDQLERVELAIDAIRDVRPWIAINAHFVCELQRFHAVVRASCASALPHAITQSLVQARTTLPRIDFGPTLVADIVAGAKTITMRLCSDCTDDIHSDLGDIFPLSTVLATTTALGSSKDRSIAERRRAFALLRVDHVETATVASLDAQAIAKTGVATAADVLRVLTQFYPYVTAQTPLRMLHFVCVACVDDDDDVDDMVDTETQDETPASSR